MSEENEVNLSEDSDDGDFSGSEDEWIPTSKRKGSSESTDDDDDKDDDDDDDNDDDDDDDGDDFEASTSNKRKLKKSLKNHKPVAKTISFAKCKQLYDSYKNSKPSTSTKTNLSLLNQYSLTTNKSASQGNPYKNDDSDSSGDDYLVDPNKIDLGSTFFETKKNDSPPPIFDCNIGLKLSDSEDDGDDLQNVPSTSNQSKPFHVVINENSSKQIDFNTHHTFNKNLETAKQQLTTFRSTNFGKQEKIDVSQLLALGETSESTIAQAPKKQKKIKTESDSDWEEVEDKHSASGDIKDVEITVQTGPKPKISNVQADLEACLKRKINRHKKERQVIIHKVHLLCLIAHGNYINPILNDPKLMQMCLGLIPSPQCYPKDRTDLKYFEQISKWYKGLIKLKSQDIYCKLKKLPPIRTSLGLQIKTKEAICKKDYIFIFIIMLRSIGIQCRLVMNLVTLPIRPPAHELCTIKIKTDVDPKKTNKVIEKPKPSKTKSSVKKQKSGDKSRSSHSIIDVVDNKNNPVKVRSKTEISTSTKSNDKPKSLKEKLAKSKASIKDNLQSSKLTEDSPGNISIEKSSTSKDKTRSLGQKIGKNVEITSKSKTTVTKISNTVKGKQLQTKYKANIDISPEVSKSNRNLKKIASKSESKSKIPNLIQSPKNTSTSKNTPIVRSESKTKSIQSTKMDSSQFDKHDKLNVLGSPVARRTRAKSKDSVENKTETKPVKQTNRKRHIETTSSSTVTIKCPQLDGGDDSSDIKNAKKKKPNLGKLKNVGEKPTSTEKRIKPSRKISEKNDTSNDDSDFEPVPKKKLAIVDKKISKLQPNRTSAGSKLSAPQHIKKSIDSRLLSSDDEDDTQTKKKGMDIWIEVYSEDEAKWFTVDLFKSKIHCVDELRRSATKPIAYVLAWNNNNTIVDVSPRYCPQWNTTTRKLRVQSDWFDIALRKYRDSNNARNKVEAKELNKIHLKEPLPKVISEYKDHPLYALERHLLKFQAIYPSNALTLGFIRNEPVYSRDCVHTLHSREIWVKQARVVKPAQEPYKIVKARPKWDRLTNKMLEPQPLEIFGYWQTQPYEPPTAENGIVPRNAYGNVELFKPEMLPKKTVHLQLPSLNRTCKKLNIDCAQAVVGFDFHSGSSHPTFDGFVICEEFAEIAVEQWWKDQEEMQRKEEEKYNQRVYGNWKKLIKGLWIRERLQRRYNFAGGSKDDDKKETKTGKKATKAETNKKKK